MNDIRSVRDALLAGRIVNECGQSIDIRDPELSVLLFEDPHFRKAIEFAGDGLAVSASAARDFCVRRRWNNMSDLALAS